MLLLDNYYPEKTLQINMENSSQVEIGDKIRSLREQMNLPLRKIAAALDIDPSTLSKIERGERSATKEMLPILAGIFQISEDELVITFLSDKVAYELLYEENTKEILKVAEEKIRYLKSKKYSQGRLNLQ